MFLALHHLIKNRGHFLFDNLSVTDIESFDKIFSELTAYLSDNYDISLTCNDSNKLSEILKDRSVGKVKKTAQILECCGVTKKGNPQITAILSTLSGSSVKLADIFCDDTLKEGECKTVSFSGKYEDSEAALESTLGERFELIEKLKAIYDWATSSVYIGSMCLTVITQGKAKLNVRFYLACVRYAVKKPKLNALSLKHGVEV